MFFKDRTRTLIIKTAFISRTGTGVPVPGTYYFIFEFFFFQKDTRTTNKQAVPAKEKCWATGFDSGTPLKVTIFLSDYR
jgi:hypothetical protein